MKKKPLPIQARGRQHAQLASASLERAIRILTAFSHSRPELTMSELTEELGMPKATVFRMLVTMAEHDMIQFNSTRESYSLGSDVLSIDIALQQSLTRTAAYPEILRLRDGINATVVLTFRTDSNRINFHKVESSHAIQNMIELGVKIPLLDDAAGHAILAGLEDEDLEAFLAAPQTARRLKTCELDEDSLLQKLTSIRRDRYCLATSQSGPTGTMIAAPVRLPGNEIPAALYVSIPSCRSDASHIRESIAALVSAASAISQKRDTPLTEDGYRNAPIGE